MQGCSSYVDYVFGRTSFKDFMTECLKSRYDVDIISYCNGVIGVPISFLDKYSPDQFEIIGLDRYTAPKECLVQGRLAVSGKPTYARILVRRF